MPRIRPQGHALVAIVAITTAMPFAEARCRRPLASLDPVPATAAHRASAVSDQGAGGQPKAAAAFVGPAAPSPKSAVQATPLALADRSTPAVPIPAQPLKTAFTAHHIQESKRSPLRPPATTWSVTAGETLRTVLERWAHTADWRLVWDAPADYSLAASDTFGGDLEGAVGALMTAMRDNGAPFGVELFRGNRVIRVVRVR